jgi:hypothetical protein
MWAVTPMTLLCRHLDRACSAPSAVLLGRMRGQIGTSERQRVCLELRAKGKAGPMSKKAYIGFALILAVILISYGTWFHDSKVWQIIVLVAPCGFWLAIIMAEYKNLAPE